MIPSIGKIEGRRIDMRLAEESDSSFILGLRLDPRICAYLSPVPDDISIQAAWMRAYKQREAAGNEVYFVIEGKGGESYGTARVYEIDGSSCAIGSWVIDPDCPVGTAGIESALLTYDFVFYRLGLRIVRLLVHAENEEILEMHDQWGARRIDETDRAVHLIFGEEQYSAMRTRYLRYAP